MEYKKAKALNVIDEAIYVFAEKVGKTFGYKSGGDLTPLVTGLGGKINFEELGEWERSEDRSIVVDGVDDFKINIGKFSSPLSGRFTIAHELGHFFLHSRSGKIKVKAERFGKGQVEREADCFAAALLMPGKEFKKVYRSKDKDVFRTAAHFLVTFEAAESRGWELKIIKEKPAKPKIIK